MNTPKPFKYVCVCGAGFNDIGEARDHEDACPQMQAAIKEEEQWQNHEIEVNDGGGIFKEIFKPDGKHTRDLEAGRIRLTNWHQWVIKILTHKLKKDGALQVGKNYVKRRLVLYGLNRIAEDNKKEISKAYEIYDMWLQKYDRRQNQQSKKARIVGDIDGRDRAMLYMEENDFSRIGDLAEIFNLTSDSIERIAFAYTILDISEYIDNEVVEEAQKDVGEFKEHLKTVNA